MLITGPGRQRLHRDIQARERIKMDDEKLMKLRVCQKIFGWKNLNVDLMELETGLNILKEVLESWDQMEANIARGYRIR